MDTNDAVVLAKSSFLLGLRRRSCAGNGAQKSLWYEVLKGSMRESPRAMLDTGGLNDSCVAFSCSIGHRLSGCGFLKLEGSLQGSRLMLACVVVYVSCVRV